MIIKFKNKNGKFNYLISNIIEKIILWMTGGLFYFYMEIAFRNYSHYSMIICGGLCFLIVGMIGDYIMDKESNILKAISLIMFFGSLTITTLELLTGIIVNVFLELDVWDYTSMKYNVYGQICLGYTLIWSLLSLLCVFVANTIKAFIFEKNRS